MASVVDICNLAVARLGDDANIASIDPPEDSIQAALCARFYPLARDTMLQSHDWSFATRRTRLASVTAETEAWVYAYALPSSCLKVISVQHYQATPDYSDGNGLSSPQSFAIETLSGGSRAILTNQDEAAARYIAAVTDSSLFPPVFVDALSWLIASHMAGPIIKGQDGATMARYCAGMYEAALAKAIISDSNQRGGRPGHRPPWIASR